MEWVNYLLYMPVSNFQRVGELLSIKTLLVPIEGSRAKDSSSSHTCRCGSGWRSRVWRCVE